METEPTDEEILRNFLEKDPYGDRLLLRRVQRGNEMFREFVLEKYGNACFFCKRKDLLNIHHRSYELKCKFFKTKFRGKGFNKGQKKYQRRIPNCKKCYRDSREVFDSCMNSVIPVCCICHRKLHRMMKKEFGNFLPSKTGKNEKRAEERLIKSLIKEQTKNLTVTNPSLNITKEVNGLEDKALFEKLKEWRKNKAKEENTLPYVVFHDTTLHEISKIKPKNEDELLKIKGIGEIKINKYGKDILSIVRG